LDAAFIEFDVQMVGVGADALGQQGGCPGGKCCKSRQSDSIHARVRSFVHWQRNGWWIRSGWSLRILLSDVLEIGCAQKLLDFGVERGLAVRIFLRGGVDGFGAGFAEQVANQHATFSVDDVCVQRQGVFAFEFHHAIGGARTAGTDGAIIKPVGFDDGAKLRFGLCKKGVHQIINLLRLIGFLAHTVSWGVMM